MRYFVTGGAGFIGSYVVDRLLERAEVTVYDNLSSGRLQFIEHHLGKREFCFIQADLLDLDRLKDALAGHDCVFHLAANPEAREGIKRTELDLRIGTIATYNVLEAMRVNEVKKLVFNSSGTVYGDTPVIPLPEDYGPLLPISLYGASKLACEGLISAYCHIFSMQAWIYRLGNIVGARATHGVIFDFINKLKNSPYDLEILGDGNQEKPYLLVTECVDAMLFGLERTSEVINLFHVGCDTSTDVITIAKIVVEEMGIRDVGFHYTGGSRGWPGDVPQVRLNVEKINRLGWKAKYTSNEAIRLAVRSILDESGGRNNNATGDS